MTVKKETTQKKTTKVSKPKKVEKVEEVVVVVEKTTTDHIKSIFLSKTFWVNIIALVAFITQKHFGYIISQDIQIEILTIVNILLRSITTEAVTWKKS